MKDNPHMRVVTMSLDGRRRRQQTPDHPDDGTIGSNYRLLGVWTMCFLSLYRRHRVFR